jgi:hypothetical protein
MGQTKAEELGDPGVPSSSAVVHPLRPFTSSRFSEKPTENLLLKTPYKFKKSYGGTVEPQTPQDAPWLHAIRTLSLKIPYKFKKSCGGTPEPHTTQDHAQDAPWLHGPSLLRHGVASIGG